MSTTTLQPPPSFECEMEGLHCPLPLSLKTQGMEGLTSLPRSTTTPPLNCEMEMLSTTYLPLTSPLKGLLHPFQCQKRGFPSFPLVCVWSTPGKGEPPPSSLFMPISTPGGGQTPFFPLFSPISMPAEGETPLQILLLTLICKWGTGWPYMCHGPTILFFICIIINSYFKKFNYCLLV